MQAYSIGAAALQFEISIQVSMPANASAGTPGSTETLSLSPSVPLALSAGRLLSARLQGDLAMYTQMPVLRCALMTICAYRFSYRFSFEAGGVAEGREGCMRQVLGYSQYALNGTCTCYLGPSMRLCAPCCSLVSNLAPTWRARMPARSNALLMIPSPSGSTPEQVAASNRSSWLLVPRDRVAFDGAPHTTPHRTTPHHTS